MKNSFEKRLSYHGPGGMPRYIIPEAPESYKKFEPTIKTVTEAAREVKVVSEADVIVVGGGPGGYAAAVTAARNGARTVLLERYGHLGGMATGGLVNIIPNLSDVNGVQYIGGICEELITRLDEQGYCTRPQPIDFGSTDPKVLKYYTDAGLNHFYIRKNAEGKECVIYTAIIDPEVGKNEISRMVTEAGVRLYLHSWVTDVIMEDNVVKGIIFESKSGRQAVLGKVVIDSTGDGDLIPWTGEESDSYIDPNDRITHLCFGYHIGGVNWRAYDRFVSTRPDDHTALMNGLYDNNLYRGFFRGLVPHEEDEAWLHPHFIAKCQTDVDEITRIETAGREMAVKTWEYLRDNAPGFENSYIKLTCPQIGTTGGRRLVGEHSLTTDDLHRTEPFEDTIAVFPNNDRGPECYEFSKIYVPYRSLLPKKVEGFMVACRAFSSDDESNSSFNLVPHCMCFGQAAGTAAAIAVKKGISVKDVPYAELKEALLAQNVILP